MHCPLCETDACRVFSLAGARQYWRCERCQATFLHPAQRPAPEEERKRYLLHRNEPDDAGYGQFLGRLATPLLARLPPAQRGLDYGCGPGPVLAMMLREAGHRVALFDPFFRPDARALTRTYDFVTCTEVAEHFHRPSASSGRDARQGLLDQLQVAAVGGGGGVDIGSCAIPHGESPMRTPAVLALVGAAATVAAAALLPWSKTERPARSSVVSVSTDRILVEKLPYVPPSRWATAIFRDEQGRSFIKRVEFAPSDAQRAPK